MTARAVLDHVIASISPASEAQAEGARQRVGADPEPGSLAALAIRLAAARHAPSPRVDRKVLAVILGEHGVADPGVDLGDAHPSVIAARAIDAGDAALVAAARAVQARVVVVDAGLTTRATLPTSTIAMSSGRGAADITRAPAMTLVDALLAIQAGIALGTALGDEGLDLLALGHVGAGAEVASAAVTAVLTGADDVATPADRPDVDATLARHRAEAIGDEPLAVLASVGGPDLALIAGLVLAAASMDVPVVLDDHATSAAALAAVRLAPAAAGYLVAAHGGSRPSHRRVLAALGLAPLFTLGLGSGEGAGAALALGLVDGAARLLR